jgi:hypothetical protein
MDIYKTNEKIKRRNEDLKSTIHFLCCTIANVIEIMDVTPAKAKLILKESLDDRRHTYR